MFNNWLSKGRGGRGGKQCFAAFAHFCGVNFLPDWLQVISIVSQNGGFGESCIQLSLKSQCKWVPTPRQSAIKDSEYCMRQKNCHSCFRCVNVPCSDQEVQSYLLNSLSPRAAARQSYPFYSCTRFLPL